MTDGNKSNDIMELAVYLLEHSYPYDSRIAAWSQTVAGANVIERCPEPEENISSPYGVEVAIDRRIYDLASVVVAHQKRDAGILTQSWASLLPDLADAIKTYVTGMHRDYRNHIALQEQLDHLNQDMD